MSLSRAAAAFLPPSARARSEASRQEPLETLKRFRTALDNGDVDFGQNLIARNSGVIQVGDEVEILTRGLAKAYGAGESDDTGSRGAAAGYGCHRMAGSTVYRQ